MDSKEVRLRKIISNAMREYLGEAKQGSDNEEIQQLVDIVDNIDSDDERRMRYINILKTKYNHQYVEGDDEDHINNANELLNIKEQNYGF